MRDVRPRFVALQVLVLAMAGAGILLGWRMATMEGGMETVGMGILGIYGMGWCALGLGWTLAAATASLRGSDGWDVAWAGLIWQLLALSILSWTWVAD